MARRINDSFKALGGSSDADYEKEFLEIKYHIDVRSAECFQTSFSKSEIISKRYRRLCYFTCESVRQLPSV